MRQATLAPRLALLSLALLVPTASATDFALPRGAVPGLPRKSFAQLELLAARKVRAGARVGQFLFQDARRDAVLYSVETELSSGAPAQLLTVELPARSLGELLRPLRASLADAFEFEELALVVASRDVVVPRGQVPPAALRIYERVYGTKRFALDFTLGLNLVGRATLRRGSPLAKALKTLGITPPSLVLQGSVLNHFDFQGLNTARKEDRLGRELAKGLRLTAFLPPVKLRGLPPSFESGQISLTVSGQPSVGLGFALNLKDAAETRALRCSVEFAKGSDEEGLAGKTDLGPSVTVVGEAAGLWKDSFGLKGLDLEDVVVQLGFDPVKSVSFGLGGRLSVGGKELGLAGQLALHPVSGAPVGGLLSGSLDSLSSDDLVQFVNALGQARGHRGRPASSQSLPDLELRQVFFKIAPFEGDKNLGVTQGFALEGSLHACDTELGFVDGRITTKGILPSLRLEGAIRDFDLGALSLSGAEVDILLGLTANPYFRLAGDAQLLAGRRRVDIRLSRKEIWFDTLERVKGVYTSKLHLSSPGAGRPAWKLSAELENELSRTLARKTSKGILAWAKKADDDFAKAAQAVENEKKKLRGLDRKIAQERAAARKRAEGSSRKLRQARTTVAGLDRSIKKERAKVHAERNKVIDHYKKVKRDVARAKKAWKRAVAKRKRARGLAVVPAKADEAAKFAAWQTANGYYHAGSKAYKAITKVPVDADPKVAGLLVARHTATGALHACEKAILGLVDLDPKVAPLLVARASALAALDTAKFSVKTTGTVVSGGARVSAWVAKNQGELLMIDRVRFATRLANYLKGSHVALEIDLRFLGKTHRVRLKASPADLDPAKLVKRLAKELEKLA